MWHVYNRVVRRFEPADLTCLRDMTEEQQAEFKKRASPTHHYLDVTLRKRIKVWVFIVSVWWVLLTEILRRRY
jgi:hypothetical protein